MRSMLLALCALGCAANTAPDAVDELELAHPGETGTLHSGLLLTDPTHPAVIQYEEIDGDWVLEGDILLTPEQVVPLDDSPAGTAQEPIAAVKKDYRWPKGLVPYQIDPALPSKQRVKDAIAHWKKYTHVRFVERTTEPDYVFFTKGTGCSAQIGRTGGRQWVKLAAVCGTGEVVHEIGHSVGLWHEQSRSDRDKHVTVRWKNIQAGQAYNFQTYVQQGMGGVDLGPYNYTSIMHYDSYAFSKNGNPTLVKKDGSVIHPNRNALNANDIAGIAKLYPAQ